MLINLIKCFHKNETIHSQVPMAFCLLIEGVGVMHFTRSTQTCGNQLKSRVTRLTLRRTLCRLGGCRNRALSCDQSYRQAPGRGRKAGARSPGTVPLRENPAPPAVRQGCSDTWTCVVPSTEAWGSESRDRAVLGIKVPDEGWW